MTATFTVGVGCAAQTGWDGTTALDLGNIETEGDKINTGFETISIAMTTSDEVIGMNILGQTRVISITGKKTGTLTELRTFTNNLKLVADYQLDMASDSFFRYKNTLSKLPNIWSSTGIKVGIKDYSINNSNTNSPGEIRYSITLTETAGI